MLIHGLITWSEHRPIPPSDQAAETSHSLSPQPLSHFMRRRMGEAMSEEKKKNGWVFHGHRQTALGDSI